MALMITGAVVFAVGAFFGAVKKGIENSMNFDAGIITADANISRHDTSGSYGAASTSGGGGRPTPWVYQDAKGNWHYTRGNKAKPFLKPAAADHAIQYRKILEDELK